MFIGQGITPYAPNAGALPSIITNSLKFDGVKMRLNAGEREYVSFPSFTLSGEFSIYFKFKTFRTHNSTTNVFLGNNDATNWIDVQDSFMRLRIAGVNTQINCTDVYDGNEHNVLWTRDSSNIVRLYIDGVNQAGTPTNAATFTLSTIARYSSGNFPIDGFLVKEIAISDGYAASQADATSLQTQLPEDVLSSLIRNYDFADSNQDSTTLVDKVNVANNGTLTGFQILPEVWRDFDDPFPTITVNNNINIALAGQSNARGKVDETTRASGVELNYLNSAAYQFGIKSKMRWGTDGINAYDDSEGGFSVEWRITQNLLGTRNVTWLKYAKGNTSVGANGGGQWAAAGSLTLAMVAEAAANSYTPSWLVWIQGESDAADATDAAAYQTNLEATFAKFRTEWGAGLKIIIVRLWDDFPGKGAFASDVQTAQDAIVAAQANTFIVNPDNEGLVYPTDANDVIHYNGLGIDKVSSACYDVINANL